MLRIDLKYSYRKVKLHAVIDMLISYCDNCHNLHQNIVHSQNIEF